MVNTLNFFRKKILGRKVAFVATSCAVKETDFDDQVCDDALKSMKIKIIRCSHKGKSSELQCLTSTMAGGNEEGFIVATNEDVYVERLQE
nr:hypothetical protein [Tanacetum cinerariifolium]